MKDKKIFIIVASLAALLLIIVLAFIIFPPGNNKRLGGDVSEKYQPEFLSVSEKQALGLPADSKIQSLRRDGSGTVMVYKIIRSDSDIVTDPSKVGPISPRQK